MSKKIPWYQIIRHSLISGSVASIFSAFSLSLLGHRDLNRSAAPINGPSQWIWGRHAPYENRFSFRYTVVGYCIHHAASIFWAIGYERFIKNRTTTNKIYSAVAPAIYTAATAYIVDFFLVPKRLTPGFENRLSKRSLVWVYGTFALGLSIPVLLARFQKLP
jgi:hypothetical protein